MNTRSEEIAYLKRLMEDFPADVAPEETHETFQRIAARYQRLEQSYHNLAVTDQVEKSSEHKYSLAFRRRAYIFHELFLFENTAINKAVLYFH